MISSPRSIVLFMCFSFSGLTDLEEAGAGADLGAEIGGGGVEFWSGGLYFDFFFNFI